MSKLQKATFANGEGDEWFNRNRQAVAERFNPATDRICRALLPRLRPHSTLAEVGCGFAVRLNHLVTHSKGRGFGIDPSSLAITESQDEYSNLTLNQGTADSLPWDDRTVDVLIYGFCLYLVDRQDLFRVAAEGDRVLTDGGLIVIYDFLPPMAYCNRYSHREGLLCFKMDYSRLWLWNPCYSLVTQEVFGHGPTHDDTASVPPDERVGVTILRKEMSVAFPTQPQFGSGR